jgi:hypothetical protein
MFTRRIMVLVVMVLLLVVATFSLASGASADSGIEAENGAMGLNADVDLRNAGVEWGGSGANTWYIYTKNVGSKAAGGFYIRVYKSNGTTLKMHWVPSLAAGATVTTSVTSTEKCLKVYVDFGNKVAEYNESNNYIFPCSPWK